MIIYYHIDELNRDAVVASALKRKFAAHGHRLVYGNRLSNRLVKYFHRAFDVIIMPRPHIVYDNWGEAWMQWQTKFVMLSTESLGIICKDHHVMARTLLEREYFQGKKEYVKRIDAFCLWGEKQQQAVREYAPELADKCHVVGHPRHDRLCEAVSAPTPHAGIPGKKRIGIITRAVALNDYYGRCALDVFSTLLDEHFQYEYYDKETGQKLKSMRPTAQPAENTIVQAFDAATTLKVIAQLYKEGHYLSIRVHPKEKSEMWSLLMQRAGFAVEVSNPALPIAAWLKGLDYIVGPPSTSFYDAVMLGVTPISISEIEPRRKHYIDALWEDNNRLMPSTAKPESIDALSALLASGASLQPDRNRDKVLKEEADFPDCADALDKVVAVCEALRKTKKSSGAHWALFESARTLFQVLWKIKSSLIKRSQNSAMFILDRPTTQFINDLVGGVK